MAVKSTFKKAYELIALLALLHVLVLGGVVGAAVLTGGVDGEKIRKMADVLRDKEEEIDPETEGEAQSKDADVALASDSSTGKAVKDAAAESQLKEEIQRREAQRIKDELSQRAAQVNRALLLFKMKVEEFEQMKAASAAKDEAVAEERDEEGFKKLVAIFDSLSAKVAAEMMLDMENEDDAARILLQMDERKAKKLVEAAKKLNRLEKMQDILQRVREVAPTKSDALKGTQ